MNKEERSKALDELFKFQDGLGLYKEESDRILEENIRVGIAKKIWNNHKISIVCEHGCSCDDAICIALGLEPNHLGYYMHHIIFEQLEEAENG